MTIEERAMEQFSLEKYLENPSRKVITRDGKSARIICTNRLDKNYPVLALVTDGDSEKCYSYTTFGKFDGHQNIDCELDLLFAPQKKEKWINVYGSPDGRNWLGANLYNTEKAAKADPSKSRVATVKIEWDE